MPRKIVGKVYKVCWIVCRDCGKREKLVTPHNMNCRRCWPCHKAAPCFKDNDGDSY